jgi:hypothetical protein
MNGTYKSSIGSMFPGKATESTNAALQEGQQGNMIWAESWSGAALGTEWKVMCPQIGETPPELISDTVDPVTGNGERTYETYYVGGSMWLSSSAGWGTMGDPDYTSTLSTFRTVVTKLIANFQEVGAVTNIYLTGVFDGYPTCYDMAIANAEYVGNSVQGFPPALGPFPAFHGPSDCDVIGANGTYWDAHDITLIITGDCTVPNEPSTWGQVKSIYR